jgi:competence protein ComEA
MKNLKTAERTVIALTLLCLVFTAGYFIGRGSSVQVISLEKLAPVSAPDGTAAPASPAAVSGAAVSAPIPTRDVSSQVSCSPGAPSGEPAVPDVTMSPDQSGKININTAAQARLEELPGIGPALAQSIIEYRERTGGFGSIEQIMDVDGIGEKKFIAMRDMITV